MTHASLFSGIGGFDLAAEWAGWTNAFNCEIEPFCKTILKYYWPDAIQYDDIRKTDFIVWRGRIDVLTGGFPCQPFSQAGKRKGTEDERHLWPEMLRAIREIRPRWIVGENVRGIITWSDGMVFEQVCADLEAGGYEVQSYLLPACGVDAPHERYRTWFIAHRADAGVERMQQGREDGVLSAGTVADADSERRSRGCSDGFRKESGQTVGAGVLGRASGFGGERTVAGTNQLNGNLSGLRAGRLSQLQEAGLRIDTNPDQHQRPEGGMYEKGSETPEQYIGLLDARNAWAGWQDFPTQPPVCGRNDELSVRLDSTALLDGRKPRNPYHAWNKWRQESIKGLGNAVVPYLVYQLFDTINQYENAINKVAQ